MADACICPVCENAAGNVVGKLFVGIFTLISNPIILVRKCNNNVDNLKNKVAKLKDEKETVENYAEAVGRRGEQIAQKITNWRTRANILIEAAEKLAADAGENAKKKCFFGLCLNPKSRYQLSKKAEENSKVIAEHVDEGRGFNLAHSHIPAPPKEVAAPVKGFQDLHSRKDVLERITEALQSPSSNIIGVHGMPGVGKTMLAKEVKRKAEEGKLFDEVVMALVSRDAKLEKIQSEIARGLGLDQLPNGITTQDAAERIKKRLKKMKKVLIILDDVWGPGIDLEELGIPLRNEPKTTEGSSSREEYPECKILLTSRDSNVLSDQMGSQQNFPLVQLENEEAWELFKRIVGDRAESDDIHSAAIEIVRECGGLPLAITTMAKALKNKKPYEWMDAVRILKRPSSENFDGIAANVYSAIEVSYSHLDSEKLKKTFLLCCLMGHRFLVQDLLKYGVGLGLFASAIEEARNEVFTLLRKLRASSLLIDDDDNDFFDMHDLIHDVAVSIACKERLGLLLTDDHEPKEWSDMEAMKDFKWICIRDPNVDGLPDELESPHLTFFLLCNRDPSLQIPPNFLKGMQRLKVLDLTAMHLSSLPPSISLLKHLHTLCLDQSVLGDMRIIGQLKNLEILSLLQSDFEELPREIGQLTGLKLLDLSDCIKLKIIPPRVLASLSKLEELYMGSFDGWEVEEIENQRNVSVAELKHLKKLTSLEVCIPHIQMIPKDLFFENLKRYKIFIGDKWGDRDSSIGGSRILKLHLNASISYNRLVAWLLKTAEELHLRELAAVKDVVAELNIEGFRDLKDLYIHNAPEAQHIMKSMEGVLFNAFPNLEVLFLQNLINLEKIFQGQFKKTAFNKLRVITVESCDKLKNLFSSSIARQLLQLQEISVTHCSNMEEIVDDEEQGSRNDIVEATELKFGGVLRSLRLEHLPKFRSVNGSCKSMQLFNEQVVFPMLEELELTDIKIGEIWNTTLATPDYTQKLTKLSIVLCSNLKYLFSSSVADGLVKLLHLEIRDCKSLREIIAMETGPEMGNCHVKFLSLKQLNIIGCPELVGFTVKSKSTNEADNVQPFFNEQVAFPSLESLILYSLENLQMIWHNQLSPDSFCILKELDVRHCKNLMTIFTKDMLGSFFKSIEKLTIWSCASVEEVFKVGEINLKKSVQTQLRNLWIFNLPSLKHVWNEDPEGILTFYNIESVIVSDCPSIKNLFPVSVTEGLKQLQKLQIERCGLEEIVSMRREGTEAVVKFVFPLLSNLKLISLQRLRYFYPGKHISLWPELKKLDVFYCGCADQVEIRSGQDQPNFPIRQPFLCMEQIIPQLERLSLSQNDIAMISELPFKQDFFFKIKDLRIDGGGEFPIDFLRRFNNLEKFALRNCSLEELFPSHGVVEEEQQKHSETQLPKIKTLKLQSVANLRHVWSGELSRLLQNLNKLKVIWCYDLISLSTSTTSFKNLTTLEVFQCLKMENLVSAATVQCLVHVKSMTVSHCLKLTEIVGSQGDMTQDPIIFSNLEYLKLNHLIRLASFSSGNCTLDFPNLEQLIVENCPKLEIFTKTVPKTPRLLQVQGGKVWKLEVDLNTTIQRMYIEKVGYVGLIALSLSEFPKLMQNWHTKILDLRWLQYLDIYNCHSLRYLLSPSMVRSLVSLLQLKVENCTIMEAVIMEEGAENAMMEEGAEKKIIIPHLFNIILVSCSDLASFYLGSCTLQCLGLKTIEVTNCPKLVTFTLLFSAEQEKEDSQALFSNEVDFPNLEVLTLSSLNIQQIWHYQANYAQNLLQLRVVGCGNLKYLFIASMFKTFEKLQQLEILDCGMMEEVIVRKGYLSGEERVYKMFFPKLDHLLLKDLHKLTRFCFGNLVEFSCLRDLQIIKCPLMETFISSSTLEDMTASSKKVENTCAPPLFDSKVAFPSVEKIVIESMECLNKIWPNLLHAESFCHLNYLRVNSCGKLLNIFPSTMLERIQKLDKLEIWNCNSLEEIFDSQGLGAIQSQSQITTQSTLVETPFKLVLPKLTHLDLYRLPKLKGFSRRMHVIEWPSLKKWEVNGCDQVQISSSKFSSF